jgi:ADP-ribose pyrophosphatase YjhB (NUDIX family)
VPPEHLVSRLHLVAVTNESQVVVCRSVQGWRFLPGGTREPGESLHELARRELQEEAGANLLGDLIHFSAHQVDSEVLALSPAAAAAYLDVEDRVHAAHVVRHAEGLGLLDRLA